MRRVILLVQVSLDGFFEGPKKEIDWHMVDDELHAHVNQELEAMGALLSGRVTYQLMAGLWPTADADAGNPPSVKEFARIRPSEGKRLFPPSKEKVPLRLAGTRTFGNGVVLLGYERVRDGGGRSRPHAPRHPATSSPCSGSSSPSFPERPGAAARRRGKVARERAPRGRLHREQSHHERLDGAHEASWKRLPIRCAR